MKRLGFLAACTITSAFSFAQTLTFQAGTSISNLDWELTGISMAPLYEQKLIGYSVFVGLDYFNQKYVNMSSNIGMIRKGGKGELNYYDMAGVPLKTSVEKPALDYVSFNTTVDFKYKIKEKITPFISMGPRIDYLVHQSDHFDGLENNGDMNMIAYGLILGGGIKYDLAAVQLGLRANYYLEKEKVAEWASTSSRFAGEVNTNTIAVNFSVGYKLN